MKGKIMHKLMRLFTLLAFLLFSCNVALGLYQSVSPIPEMDVEVAEAGITKLESQYVVQNTWTSGMTPQDQELFSQQLVQGNMGFELVVDAPTTIDKVLVPAMVLPPDTLNLMVQLIGQSYKHRNALDPVALHYVMTHATNHMRAVGISPTDVGKAAAYFNEVINQAVRGNGVMFYRPASVMYEEAYFFATKIDNRIWGIWLDSYGRPLTGYEANQRTLDGVAAKYLKDGFIRLYNWQQLSPGILKNWVAKVPPAIRLYVWGLERIAQQTAINTGVSTAQAIESMAAVSMRLSPPIPVIINPCLLSPTLSGCTKSEMQS